MNTTERLEELLNQKDDEIKKLSDELFELKDQEEADWRWARPRILNENVEGLPIPRMEIRYVCTSERRYNYRWEYCMIYRHFAGHLVAIPLGVTQVGGSSDRLPIGADGIETPFRDGVHIVEDAKQIGIPACAIVEGTIAELGLSAKRQIVQKRWRAEA